MDFNIRTYDIFNACYLGDLDTVETLLLKGVSANVTDEEGNTPLQIASANGDKNIFNILVKNGALIDFPNNYGWTPLMHATLHCHIDIVASLLRMKAKVNACNKLGVSVADIATWSGMLPILKLLIDAGTVVDRAPLSRNNKWDSSCLMVAAFQGHEMILKLLLEKDAAVNDISPVTGLTPLMLASCNGHIQAVKIILDWGGHVNRLDICGKSALDMAIECRHEEIQTHLDNLTMTTFMDNTLNEDILQAVRRADLLKVKSIIENNSKIINVRDGFDGTTPLMQAAMFGYNDILEVLINSAAHLDVQDCNNGWTALMFAVFHRNVDAVNILVKHGANLDVEAFSGYTALDLARHIGGSEPEIIQILEKHSSFDDVVETRQFWFSQDKTEQRNLSIEENITPKRSPSQTLLKDSILEVDESLQQKGSSSSKLSACSPISDIADIDQVFLDCNSFEATEKAVLGLSKFLAPNKYFASVLREHKVGAIRPPFLSSRIDDINVQKGNGEKLPKQNFNSLQVPHLLKSMKKKYSSARNSSKNSNSFDSLVLDESNEATKLKFELSSEIPAPEVEKDEVNAEPGDLTALLNKESLKKYADKFREQEIDLEAFLCMTDDDFNEIGIDHLDSRQKLLSIITKIKNT